jgi:hypothetical protein
MSCIFITIPATSGAFRMSRFSRVIFFSIIESWKQNKGM